MARIIKKKVYIIFLIIIGVVCLSIFLVYEGLKPRRSDLFDSYLYETEGFKIKAETRYQSCYLLPLFNAYHDYYVKTNESDRWRLICTLLFDDPLEIPEDQIVRVSDRITYFYIGWMYAVTTDSGVSWHTWDGNPKSTQLAGTGYGFIDDIRMGADGAGVMSILNKKGKLVKLYTKDFGRTWEE